jgi:hypothetical protein
LKKLCGSNIERIFIDNPIEEICERLKKKNTRLSKQILILMNKLCKYIDVSYEPNTNDKSVKKDDELDDDLNEIFTCKTDGWFFPTKYMCNLSEFEVTLNTSYPKRLYPMYWDKSRQILYVHMCKKRKLNIGSDIMDQYYHVIIDIDTFWEINFSQYNDIKIDRKIETIVCFIESIHGINRDFLYLHVDLN